MHFQQDQAAIVTRTVAAGVAMATVVVIDMVVVVAGMVTVMVIGMNPVFVATVAAKTVGVPATTTLEILVPTEQTSGEQPGGLAVLEMGLAAGSAGTEIVGEMTEVTLDLHQDTHA
mmetsp:Transcript_30801/g.60099  ORF Transcript_30801/g.60099 Transcript_30801/m.60099 type:complete len:116 (+) Transcript_30801:102-449(+)